MSKIAKLMGLDIKVTLDGHEIDLSSDFWTLDFHGVPDMGAILVREAAKILRERQEQRKDVDNALERLNQIREIIND
jgi:hypothetical protein